MFKENAEKAEGAFIVNLQAGTQENSDRIMTDPGVFWQILAKGVK